MNEDGEEQVDRLLQSVFPAESPAESLDAFKGWVATWGARGRMNPEPQDLAAARAGRSRPLTTEEATDRYRLAQAYFLLRIWQDAKLRGTSRSNATKSPEYPERFRASLP